MTEPAAAKKDPKAKMVWRKVSDLEYPGPGPKIYSEAEITEHLAHVQHYGQTRPVFVHNNNIIDGEPWYHAAERLQKTELPVVDLSHMSELDARAYTIAVKKLAERGEWDWAFVVDEWNELKETDFPDLDLTGFDADERKKIRATQAREESEQSAQEGEDDIPEITKYPVTRTGDIWSLGPHRVICGDSFDEINMDTLIDGEQVHLIATDPPYAVHGSSTGIASDISDDKIIRPFFDSLVQLAEKVLPWFGHVYMFTDWRTYSSVFEAVKRTPNMEPKNCIVWDKGGAGLGSNYANSHEFIAFASKLPPQKAMGSRESGQRLIHRPNVMRHNRVTGDDRHHNAAKPVALMRELIDNSSGPGDVVLEPFAGSGTTLIAANQAERVCFACEMEPKYVDVIIARFEKLTDEKATLYGTDKTFAEVEIERQAKHHRAK